MAAASRRGRCDKKTQTLVSGIKNIPDQKSHRPLCVWMKNTKSKIPDVLALAPLKESRWQESGEMVR